MRSPRALTGGARDRVLREAAGNPLALIELPLTADSEAAVAQPGLVSLTQRLERAFAARLSDLPEDTRLLLLVTALNDRDSVDEVLQPAPP